MKHVEFAGGLGDVFNTMFFTDRYALLETLTQEHRASVDLVSHNPHAKELFLWHPNRDFFSLVSSDWWDIHNSIERIAHGFQKFEPEWIHKEQGYINFYASSADLGIISHLKAAGKYVVVSAAAGEQARDIPKAIRELAIKEILRSGMKVVVLGRNYNRDNRQEHDFPTQCNVVNLIDRLTVPGVALAVAGSSGSFCCFSSVMILSWGLKKRTFVTYPMGVKDGFIGPVTNPYTWGNFLKGNVHVEHSEWSAEIFGKWLSSL